MFITNNALSLKQMKELINYLGWNNKIDVGLYSKLNFNNGKPKIILLQSQNNPLQGHFFCYIDDIFYDPSANKPGELWIKYNLDNNYQNANNLINYFTKFNQFDYNDYDYQKNKDSQTCGHHCICRLYWYFNGIKSNDDYNKFLSLIKKKYHYNKWDDLIVDMMRSIFSDAIVD